MGKIITYNHHNCNVNVDEDLKGKHTNFCLCYRNCIYFKPGKEDNCEIANANYQLCVKYNLVTPVFECPKYKKE